MAINMYKTSDDLGGAGHGLFESESSEIEGRSPDRTHYVDVECHPSPSESFGVAGTSARTTWRLSWGNSPKNAP